MLFVRKLDWYAELGGVIATVAAIPLFFLYGFVTTLLIPAFIQVLSASLNTAGCVHYGLKREIRKYWLFTGIEVSGFGAAYYALNGDPLHILFVALSAGGTAISVYYLFIYKNLIATLELKNELAGFTKS